MAAGDTGGMRPGGEKAADSFQKRENANENMWIRDEERKKLLQLKERLKSERQHIDELDKHIDELVKEQGGQGEQN